MKRGLRDSGVPFCLRRNGGLGANLSRETDRIVGLPPGGAGNDIIARLVARRAGELGQPW